MFMQNMMRKNNLILSFLLFAISLLHTTPSFGTLIRLSHMSERSERLLRDQVNTVFSSLLEGSEYFLDEEHTNVKHI